MTKRLLKFHLDDGTPYFFEVEDVTSGTGTGPSLSGRSAKELAVEASKTLDEALRVVQPVTKQVVDRLRSGLTKDANEVEVKFGLKLTAGTDVIFASVGGEVNFEVTLKWKQD
ncbi:MAG: hypothetical protein B0A82_24510 [Alkalinema sp. CACIAM 70d]|nr:MAG: hypothetical protein B0A82_24510 [Alkalinema sp. CACIAM 70d]